MPALPHGWLESNRANWDERVGIHLDAPEYNLAALRAGKARLFAIEEAELGPVSGRRILHLQCHFGGDSLALAQQGANVVGVDFSPVGIATAKQLTQELGLEDRATFFEANVLEADRILPDIGMFDCVFVTWGTTMWLPDINRWAEVVAHFLKPGGQLYFADAHPSALILDDETPEHDGRPGWFIPYFSNLPFIDENAKDYTGDNPALKERDYSWMQPIGGTISALLNVGLRIDHLREHDRIPWPMFKCLVTDDDGLYVWPEKPWFPLSWSVKATKI